MCEVTNLTASLHFSHILLASYVARRITGALRSVSALCRVAPSLCCPSMMDDSVYCDRVPLAVLSLIGLKQVHLGSTSMVAGRVYVWIISACSLPCRCLIWWRQGRVRTVPNQNRLGMKALSHSVAFCRKQCSDAAGEKKEEKNKNARWLCKWHDSRFPHSCCHGNV